MQYTFKSDVLFKMLFVQHPGLLKRLVAVLLDISLESIADFGLANAEMPPEEIGSKRCRLDICMNVDGRRVNLEIQVQDEGNYPERVMFYWARLFSTSLPAGDDYSLLPQTIIISIVDFDLFDGAVVHSEFMPLEVRRHTLLSDKMSFHFLELSKLPELEAIDLTDEKALWLALFNAETEEELAELSQNGGAVMNEAITAYRGITAQEKFRHLQILRDMARHDEAQALANARRQRDLHWQAVVADKDAALADQQAALADKDAALADKDAALADKDVYIAELLRKLSNQ